MDITITGLAELQERVEGLDGGETVPMTELFPDTWMDNHTEHESIDAFIESSPWEGDTREQFTEIPDEPWDDYVGEQSEFDDWQSMLQSGATDWVERQL